MSPIAMALIWLLVTYAAKNTGGIGGNMGGSIVSELASAR